MKDNVVMRWNEMRWNGQGHGRDMGRDRERGWVGTGDRQFRRLGLGYNAARVRMVGARTHRASGKGSEDRTLVLDRW